jgi:anti-sigma-K factor RskA
MTGYPSKDSADELDALASEYVLGTLPAEQRLDVQHRLGTDADLRAAVDAWEGRLLALTELAKPQTPSPQLWDRIARSVSSHDRRAPVQAPAVKSHSWWDLLPLWRWLAGAGLVATLLLGSMLLTRTAPVNPTTYLVVLVAPQDQAPGWVIQANNPEEIQLIPLGATPVPADKVLQFWTKADGWQGPVSLGLVKPGQTLSIPVNQLPPLQPNQLFELTLENPNGSPTGKPTGPIQFIGRAVKVI